MSKPDATSPPVLAKFESRVFSTVGPTCVLDTTGNVACWNTAFGEVLARPLGLAINHPSTLTTKLSESRDRQVWVEELGILLPERGVVQFRVVGSQLADDDGQVLGWSLHFVPIEIEQGARIWDAIVNRIDEEITWSKYARVYDTLLQQFQEYNSLLSAVAELVGDATRCIDLGAGTGNSATRLLRANDRRSVLAVDANASMLKVFRTKVTASQRNRLRIVESDIQAMPWLRDGDFDAATMVNVLYALDEPADCLREVRRVLSNDGALVVTTPHSETSVPSLFTALEGDLKRQGLFEGETANAFHAARERHAALDSKIHRFNIDQIRDLITTCGFSIESMRPAYVDAVVLLKARKT